MIQVHFHWTSSAIAVEIGQIGLAMGSHIAHNVIAWGGIYEVGHGMKCLARGLKLLMVGFTNANMYCILKLNS